MKRIMNHGDGPVKRIIAIAVIVSAALLLGAGSVYGFRGDTADEGLRSTLSHAEKVALLMEEDESMTRWQIEARIAQMDAVHTSEIYGARGKLKANLSLRERINLVMEEYDDFGYNDIPKVVDWITREVEAEPAVGLGYHKPYISGSMMLNLDREEKIRTVMEEDRSLNRWEAEMRVDAMGPVQ